MVVGLRACTASTMPALLLEVGNKKGRAESACLLRACCLVVLAHPCSSAANSMFSIGHAVERGGRRTEHPICKCEQ